MRHFAARPGAAATTAGADRGRGLGRTVSAARSVCLRLWTPAASTRLADRRTADLHLHRQRGDTTARLLAGSRLARGIGSEPDRSRGCGPGGVAGDVGLA